MDGAGVQIDAEIGRLMDDIGDAARVAAGYVVLPDGDLLEADSFNDLWDDGDRALEQDLLEYLESGSLIDRIGVLRALGNLEIAGSDAAVLELLEEAFAAERRF